MKTHQQCVEGIRFPKDISHNISSTLLKDLSVITENTENCWPCNVSIGGLAMDLCVNANVFCKHWADSERQHVVSWDSDCNSLNWQLVHEETTWHCTTPSLVAYARPAKVAIRWLKWHLPSSSEMASDHQHGGFQNLLSCQSERPNCTDCCSMQRIDSPSWMTFKFKRALILGKMGAISWIAATTLILGPQEPPCFAAVHGSTLHEAAQ